MVFCWSPPPAAAECKSSSPAVMDAGGAGVEGVVSVEGESGAAAVLGKSRGALLLRLVLASA